MPEKVAVLSKIRLLLFISPKFTTCRHPRAICRKDTAVRIEADGYFLWLEKWIMQCYFVMSSEKKIPHKIPTMWSMFFICKLFNNCKMQKIRQLSKCVQWVHLPPPLKTQRNSLFRINRKYAVSKRCFDRVFSFLRSFAFRLPCSRE